MNIRKSTLSAAVAALVSIGVVSQASAYTSAGSKIEYQNLEIMILEDGSEVFGNVKNFNFVTTNTTTLNGSTIADSDQCAGVTQPAFVNNCNAAPPRLNSDLQKLGTSGHTENNFNLDGPNAGTEYSYSDSVIQSAQLTGDPTTSASLIAETELLNTGGGNSSSVIQSTTGFLFTFTVGANGEFELGFDANPQAYAASDNPGSVLTIAESSVAMTMRIVEDNGPGVAEWTPDGDGANGCNSTGGGVTCGGEIDSESLNEKTAIASDPASDTYSTAQTFSNFFIRVSGLTAGDWTFSFTSTVANSVTKVAGVPEPGTMLLLGAGLLGLGAARRRVKRA